MSRANSDSAGDRTAILSEALGVQTKKGTAVLVEEDQDYRDTDNDCSGYHSPYKLVPDECDSPCYRGTKRCPPAPSLTPVYALVSVCLLAVLLMLAALLCNFRWDKQRAAEMEALREEVQRLTATCQLHRHWPHNNADRVAGYDASTGDGGPGGEASSPWRQGDVVPPMHAVPGFGAAALRWQTQDGGGSRWVQDDTGGDVPGDKERDYDDYGDDDDDDDDDDDGDDMTGEENAAEKFLNRIRRSSGAENKKKKAKKAHSGKSRCSRVHKCLKEAKEDKKTSKRCRKIKKCLPDPPAPAPSPVQFTPKAVHYMSDFWNNQRQQQFGKERTLNASKETPLKFLHPAPWMKTVYSDPSQQPILPEGDGGQYKVTQAGLYLIYSSVMFHDNKPRQSQALVVNGQKLFKCMDSVDYIDRGLPAGSNQAKYKSCVMTGVTHLKVDDRLEIQNLYANTEIDLSRDATYFGAVLLSPGEITTNNA